MYWGFKWSTVKIPVLRRGDGRASYKAREIHAHPRLPPPLLSLATSLLLGEVFSMNEIDDAMAVLNRTSHNDAVRAVLSHNRK